MRRSLNVVASLVAEHRLQSTGSVVVTYGLSCSLACGTFLDQGSNPCPLDWQADSLPLDHQGSPLSSFQESPFKISPYPTNKLEALNIGKRKR